MKIIFDCRYTRIGRHDGISRYTARLVEELSKLHPVSMLISDPRQLEMLPRLPWIMTPPPTAATEAFISRWVNRHEPDVVFTPMQTMGPAFRRYALVNTVHDLIYYKHRTPPHNLNWAVRLIWRGYHLWWGFQRALLNQADAQVVDSETTRNQMLEHSLSRKPIHVLLLGTEHPPKTPKRTMPENRNIVYMGSFMPYKNVELIVRALNIMPGFRLQLMSRIGDEQRARLMSIAPEDSIEFFNGASDEQYETALKNAFALVTASKDEGFGLPIVEAMALGTPVAISDTEIFHEVGGEAAEYFDPDSVESLADALRRLENAAEWKRRSVASVEWAKRYSWPDAAAQLLTILTEAAEARSKIKAGPVVRIAEG
ncbi:MAG: glycosyltransferase family 1 protein [Salinibacterium sp.]|nr:MAG: glycosyltransferase family 1 protein [Salinibacterium sp.]